MKTDVRLEHIRHSLAHLLAAAVVQKFPDVKLGIGPTIDDGFYYDFLIDANKRGHDADSRGKLTITESDLKDIEKTMKKMIGQKLPFTGKEITATEAKKLFKDQPFKLELIEEFTKESKKLTVYSTGDIFIDLCRGGHVENTEEIDPDSFKLDRLAGAYWRGDEKNPQLQRIYGAAFENSEALKRYLDQRAEAEKRDHKKLGPKLDLFTFSELVGSGLPLWTPKGTVLRNALIDFVWELRNARGYERVEIPHIAKKELYERSGHWEKFKEDLFKITTREKHLFAMKPMNCPHHAQIYARRQWSYRELPQRYANTTMVYRDEQSGELSGLARVLSITQDDAHVFCRTSQVKVEILQIWDIVNAFYGSFGFSLQIRLSLRDPSQPEKYLGAAKNWDNAENQLRKIIKEEKTDAAEAPGEAAFYGPKIDFIAHDSLGREWQVATIQLDMVQPERFDLTCINEKGEKERIVMIHAAITGSIERLLAILIEHFAGAFPLWLSPVQVEVIPVSEKFEAYGEKAKTALEEKNIRVEMKPADETLGRRIRAAELMKTPYVLVVGEKEEKNATVNVRHYKEGQIGELSINDLVKKLAQEIREKKI